MSSAPTDPHRVEPAVHLDTPSPPDLLAQVTEHGHGRRGTRTTKVLQVTADEAGFPHAWQLVQVRRTRTVYLAGGSGKETQRSVEVVYLLCSLPHVDAPTQTLARWAQSH